MISFLTAKHASFLQDLNRIQERADRAQRQLSSGLRMNVISDYPDQIGVLLQSRADLATAEQTSANLSRAKAEVDTAENALQNAIKTIERVRVLGTRGLTGTQTASTRQLAASEVESLLGQLVSIANTAIDGRYIFSGSADQTPPYGIDLTAPPGVTPYAGAGAGRQIRDASGARFSIAHTGEEIFDSATPSRNAFAAANNLRVALLANDEDGIRAAVADVGMALDHLNEQLAFYGGAQNHIAAATDTAATKILALRTEIADTEGADLAQSILELQDAGTHRQAALQAQAQEDRRTIFDFIR